MAYNTLGLYAMTQSGRNTIWGLDTVDAVGTVVGAGYITDAQTAGSGKGAPGKGMRIRDLVWVAVVDSVTVPTSVSDVGWYYVSTISATTGAATVVAVGAT